MNDIQDRQGERRMPINKVGINDLIYPIVLQGRQQNQQETAAHLSMSVSLPRRFKATDMPCFIEVLNERRGEVMMQMLPNVLHELCRRLNAKSAHIEVKFPYFIERTASVSKTRILMNYDCSYVGESTSGTDVFVLGVRVPVTSLCPHSKDISDYGAHTQRWYITIEVRRATSENKEVNTIWIEELVEIAERSAPAPATLSKFADERHVMTHSSDDPVFVDDMVRNAATQLQRDFRVGWFRVYVTYDDSFHNHSAFALIEWERGSAFI